MFACSVTEQMAVLDKTDKALIRGTVIKEVNI
jgi:hypothetical protein